MRLLELAGANEVDAKFTSRSWAQDPSTLLELIWDVMAFRSLVDELLDQLGHAGAVVRRSHPVGALLQRRASRSPPRRRTRTALEERVVVLGVADADDVVRRQAAARPSAAASPVALLTPAAAP